MAEESYRRRLEGLRAQIESERASWIPQWQAVCEYLLPWRGRFLGSSTDRNNGRNRQGKIIDETGSLALRTLASGMQSGITNPARPWLRLTTADPDLAERGSVKAWLHFCENALYDVFRKSNIYNTLHVAYGDIGGFGTAAISIEEDVRTMLRAQTFPIGSYGLSANASGRVDTCCRTFSMTVRQVVERFGLETISETVRRLWDKGNYEAWVEVAHLVHPNLYHDPRSALAKHKRYASCWWELGRNGDQLLHESGFDRFPILCPRWAVDGEDVYGHGPGMDILPSVRQLQSMVKKKGKAVEKMIEPPLVGATELRNSTVNAVPGGITYTSFRDGKPGLMPIHEVRPPVAELREDISEIQNMIRRGSYEDLFLMLALSDRRQITAREVEERHEEKLIMLGPVLERLDDDLLSPLVDIAFDTLMARDMLPPPPEELQGQDLKVEYVNILAQAQRMLGIGGVESLLGFVAQAAAVKPDIIDKIDLDEAADEYGTKLGVSPRILVSREKVAQIRGERAQQQAAAQQLAAAREGAAVAKDLAAAPLDTDNALAGLLGR